MPSAFPQFLQRRLEARNLGLRCKQFLVHVVPFIDKLGLWWLMWRRLCIGDMLTRELELLFFS